jgi:hypothetical protein
VGRALAVAVWVDPKVHAAEVARFRSKIVAGPGDGDCSIWIGSIGADGYGRNQSSLHANAFHTFSGCGTSTNVKHLSMGWLRGRISALDAERFDFRARCGPGSG